MPLRTCRTSTGGTVQRTDAPEQSNGWIGGLLGAIAASIARRRSLRSLANQPFVGPGHPARTTAR